MCVTSYVADYARETIPGRYQWIPPYTVPIPGFVPGLIPNQIPQFSLPAVDSVPRYEFDALKREVEHLKILLIAALKYDTETGQHECEQGDKVAFLRKIAEFVGVDLTDVLK